MSSKLEITRELAERFQAFLDDAFDGGLEGILQEDCGNFIEELRALLAATAVERQEPFGYWLFPKGLPLHGVFHKPDPQIHSAGVIEAFDITPLYTSPPAPVAVAELCQQLESVMAMFAPGEDKTNRTLIAARAYLDKVKELNQ